MIMQLEEENKNMTQAQTKGTTLIQEEITTQSVEAIIGKVHAGPGKRKGTRRQVPHPSRGCFRERAMPRWLRTSHMSVLGACWAQAYFEEIPIFGR
jgi:hypothetical protein